MKPHVDRDQIAALVMKALPDECEAVGIQVVQQISGGETRFAEPKGGHGYDYQTIIEVLIQATSLVAAVITICDFFLLKKQPLSREKILDEIKASNIKADLISQEIDHIVDVCLSRLENEKPDARPLNDSRDNHGDDA